MSKDIDHDDYVAERMSRSPEFTKEYNRLQENTEFRDALVRARNLAGISQAELARRIGSRQPHISDLETGEKTPSIATVSSLAEALGVRFTFNPDASVEVVAAD